MVARCTRKHDRIALLMIDIDHFKAYNDIYGHPAATRCLRRSPRSTRRRAIELVARYGGEEFAILLPEYRSRRRARRRESGCLDALSRGPHRTPRIDDLRPG